MPRQFFKRWAPSPQKLREIEVLRHLGESIYATNLWHFNRLSVARGFAIGLFCAMLPIPFQTIVAAVIAIGLRANLPLCVSLVFITNPLTMPVIFYAAYKLGALLLGLHIQVVEFEMSWEWLSTGLIAIWEPLLLGSLICGIALAGIGYMTIDTLWRLRVAREWRRRRQQRRKT
jgi:uncharacterized protein (DUF2062 family)